MKGLNIILFFFLVFGIQQASCQSSTYPDGPWVQPDTVKRWDPKKLDTLQSFIIDSTNGTGMAVTHNGQMVFQYGDIKELSYLASCRKSVCAMLYGPFVENGTINLHETLEHLQIDDIGGLLPIEKQATVENILNARSGVYHPASNPGTILPTPQKEVLCSRAVIGYIITGILMWPVISLKKRQVKTSIRS